MKVKKQKAAALTTAHTTNQQHKSYRNCAFESRVNLQEKLAAEITAIWIYLRSPFLCQAEHRQALRLFESTSGKYLAVKHCGLL